MAAPLCAAVPSDGLGYTGSDPTYFDFEKGEGRGFPGRDDHKTFSNFFRAVWVITRMITHSCRYALWVVPSATTPQWVAAGICLCIGCRLVPAPGSARALLSSVRSLTPPRICSGLRPLRVRAMPRPDFVQHMQRCYRRHERCSPRGRRRCCAWRSRALPAIFAR